MRTTILIGLLALTATSPAAGGQGQAAAAPPAPSYSAANVRTVPAHEVVLGHQRDAALAQYYRWFQLTENPASSPGHLLDILDENVVIESSGGIVRGHAGVRAQVAAMKRSQHHAHDVRSAAVQVEPDGAATLTAEVGYSTPSQPAGGAGKQTNLRYTADLRPGGDGLPKFTRIKIVANGPAQASDFETRYAVNRAKSLAYYWLALIDNPNRNAEPFKEIFATDFALNFSAGKLDSFAKFKAWYEGNASTVKYSTHVTNSMTVELIAPDTFGVVGDFDWQGVMPDGRIMVGRTQNTWVFVDNPSERFARIRSADIKMLVPFQPKP